MHIGPVDGRQVPELKENKRTNTTWNNKHIQMGAVLTCVVLAITTAYIYQNFSTILSPTLTTEEQLQNIRSAFRELTERRDEIYDAEFKCHSTECWIKPGVFSIRKLEKEIKETLSQLDQCSTQDVLTCSRIAEQASCQPKYIRSWDIDYDATQGELRDKFLEICNMIKNIR